MEQRQGQTISVNNVNRISHIKIIYTNADGVSNKQVELSEIINNEKPHIVLITETKLNSSDISTQIFKVNNYNIYRKDRVNEDGGGGVALLVHQDLFSELIPDNLFNTETIACKIQYDNQSVLIGCIYRPPSSTSEYCSRVNKVIDKLSQYEANQCLICGDFNYPKIDWNNNLVNAISESKEQLFYDTCQNNFLFQHVDEFTRQRGGDEPSMLDLVFSKNELEIENIYYKTPLGNSDHSVLVFDFTLERNIEIEEVSIAKKKYFKADYKEMNAFYQEIDWESELSGLSIQDKWNYVSTKNKFICDKLVPEGLESGGNVTKPKWFNGEVRVAINRKVEAWKEHRKKRNNRSFQNYVFLRNKATDVLRKAKFNFEKNIAREVKKGDKASFYAYARSQTSIKEGVSMVQKRDGSLTTSKKETADEMNLCFQSVFIQEGDELVPRPETFFNDKLLDDIHFDKKEVNDIMNHLKESSAPGPDIFHPKVLNECANNLAEPFYMIFRQSLDEGELPEDWKQANVTPIFKKGKKSDPLNYRPISLTSVPCKIMEKIIRNRIVEHLESNNLLSIHQHGFRSRRSCLTQLLEYFSEIHDMIDDGDPVDAIYLDCKKAFDTVPHKRLIEKLKSYGIVGKTLNWIKDFLSNRTQRVIIKGVASDTLPVWSGVPQGSVLGPVLFLIYINDLLEGIVSSGKLFADDSKLFKSIKSELDRNILQEDLLKLQAWSRKWLLQFNEKKCKVMHIGRSNPGYEYQMNDTTLEVTVEEKDLGVYVTPDWKCAAHVGKAAAKANSMVGWIGKTFSYMDCEMFRCMYPGLVRSHMEYAVQAWSPQYRKDIEVLEKVQRRATKLIPEIKDKSYEERLKIIGLTTLEDRRIRGDLIEVFKIMHGFENLERKKFFKLSSEVDSRDTRGHKYKIWTPRRKSLTRRQFFDIRVIKNWNSLPPWVVESGSVLNFKVNLDVHIKRRGNFH